VRLLFFPGIKEFRSVGLSIGDFPIIRDQIPQSRTSQYNVRLLFFPDIKEFSSFGFVHPDLQSGGSAVSRSFGINSHRAEPHNICEAFLFFPGIKEFRSVGFEHRRWPDHSGSTPTEPHIICEAFLFSQVLMSLAQFGFVHPDLQSGGLAVSRTFGINSHRASQYIVRL
jgi:hypothetical protein